MFSDNKHYTFQSVLNKFSIVLSKELQEIFYLSNFTSDIIVAADSCSHNVNEAIITKSIQHASDCIWPRIASRIIITFCIGVYKKHSSFKFSSKNDNLAFLLQKVYLMGAKLTSGQTPLGFLNFTLNRFCNYTLESDICFLHIFI